MKYPVSYKGPIQNRHIALYLVASYAYYELDTPIMSDGDFDEMAKDLLKSWDTLEHAHKCLITEEDLRGGSLLLKEEDYPLMVKGSANRIIGENITK